MINCGKTWQCQLKNILLIIFCVLMLIQQTLSVNAYYDQTNKCSSEVLLNKPNITYNPAPLENYVKEGSIKIINIEDEDLFGSSKSNSKEELVEDKSLTQNEHDYDWESGTYYLYRSHYNSDLSVVLNEVNDSFLYSTKDPVKMNITKEVKFITFDFELDIQKSIVDFIEEKGYEVIGYQKEVSEDGTEEKLKRVNFKKGEKPEQIILRFGMIDKSIGIPDEQLSPNDVSFIWVAISEGVSNKSINKDVKEIIEFLELDSTLWDNANLYKYTNSEYVVIDGEWINLSGLSVKLIIPTKWNEITIDWKTKTLNVDFEIELNNTIIEFMENQGYEESGQIEVSDELKGLVFSKGELDIFISVGEGGKTDKGLLQAGESVIWAEGPKYLVNDGDINNEIKNMLSVLKIEPNEWDNVKEDEQSKNRIVLVPSVDIDSDKFNWNKAMQVELTWLINQTVIKGLVEKDIQEISGKVKAGHAGYNSRIISYNGTWIPYFETGISLEKGDTYDFHINLKDLPETAPGENVSISLGVKYSFHTIIFYICLVSIIIIIGILSFTRLKKRFVLENINRKNIYEIIKAKPGIYFNELLRELNIKPGALSYHLNVLERKEYIKSIQDNNYRRFYLYGAKSDFKLALTNIQQRIISVVNERPGITQSNISKTIGSNKMVVNYNVKILRDAGILDLEKNGRVSQCYLTNIAKYYNG
jgi:predicted transcriptional regulator